jgi:hypothetical protein
VAIWLSLHDELGDGMYAVQVVREVIQSFWSMKPGHEHVSIIGPADRPFPQSCP